jgi:predicted ATP-dependent endonuclease of OLD family
MKLITEVTVDHFRSIRAQKIGDLGHFTVIVGLNNSGKSNLLRALHAFFQNKTDVDLPFDFMRDYFCHDMNTKKAKRVSVTVKFDLPQTFKFRKGLDAANQLLGNSFALRKLWSRNGPNPFFYLNDSTSQLNQEQQSLVEQFLSLISFRYIPNRVLPLDIIRNEHKALRDVLIRRIASKAKKQQAVFKDIESTSANLIKSLQYSVHSACPDVGSIRLATPTSWQDLIFAFGYKMKVKDVEIDDSAQGSGIQSLLMFETLSLIDRDYFQKFGWRQAAIWAVEEPEASLHSSLEARVADYLGRLANDPNNRLQVFGTSHSDLILQHSDKPILASMQTGETKFEAKDRQTVLQEAAKIGISRWTHPVLHNPLYPVVLVEGKYDCAFLEQAFRLLAPQKTLHVSYLERLQGGDATGGDKHLQQYIKANGSAIKTRTPSAPVVILLDWDSAKRADEFKKGFNVSDPYRVEVWPDSAFNPNLEKSFHGIERHFSDRIIDEADKTVSMIATKRDGKKAIPKDADYDQFKAAAKKVVDAGITVDDLVHMKNYLQQLLASLEIQNGGGQ